MPGQDLLDLGPHPDELVGLEDQVGDRPLAARGRLVQDHPRVRQQRAPPGRARRQQHRADADGLAHAGGRDRRLDVLHGVVDGQHGRQVAALAVDVQVDLRLGALRLEVDELRDERVGHARVDAGAQVDDALGEQLRVHVDDPLRLGVLGDHVLDGVRTHEATTPCNPSRRVRAGMTWPNESTIPSMNPYSRASAAVYQWSCSESSKIRDTGWPVSSEMSPSTVSTVCRRSSAWTSMSTALPPIPAEPRCIRMRACGSANRLPGAPAESRNCPALQARPRARVETSHGTSRMMSRMASMDGTEPPGELIHSATSVAESSAASASNCVISKVPLSSSSTPSSTSTRRSSSCSRARSLK